MPDLYLPRGTLWSSRSRNVAIPRVQNSCTSSNHRVGTPCSQGLLCDVAGLFHLQVFEDQIQSYTNNYRECFDLVYTTTLT